MYLSSRVWKGVFLSSAHLAFSILWYAAFATGFLRRMAGSCFCVSIPFGSGFSFATSACSMLWSEYMSSLFSMVVRPKSFARSLSRRM